MAVAVVGACPVRHLDRPALHLVVAWTRRDHALAKLDYALILGQALIFAIALHVRWPLLWLVPALCGTWIVRRRRQPKRANPSEPCGWRSARSLLVCALFFLIVGGGIVAVNVTAHPVYRIDGDVVHHPFWHHMMASLQSNPAWANKYLATVNGVAGDAMPAEIAKQEIAKLPPGERSKYLMRIRYPSAEAIAHFARKRFLEILLTDPGFVLHTFLVVSTKHILKAVLDFYLALAQVLTPSRAAVAVIALSAIAWVAAGDPEAQALARAVAVVAGAFSVMALMPVVIASPVHQIVMVDHFLWALFFLCLLACWGAAHLLRRAGSGNLRSGGNNTIDRDGDPAPAAGAKK